MITVRITQNTVAKGRPVHIGEELELDDYAARLLVNMGKAELVGPAPGAPPSEVETATDKKAEEALEEAQGRTGRWGKVRK